MRARSVKRPHFRTDRPQLDDWLGRACYSVGNLIYAQEEEVELCYGASQGPSCSIVNHVGTLLVTSRTSELA